MTRGEALRTLKRHELQSVGVSSTQSMGPQVQTFSALPVECPLLFFFSPVFSPLPGLQSNWFFPFFFPLFFPVFFSRCVHVNVSNNKDLQHEKQ